MRKERNLFSIVNDIPLNRKFLLIYLLCVLIPIATINALFFDRVSQNIRNREYQNCVISVNRAANDISAIIEEGVALSHSISIDRTFNEALNRRYRDQVEYYEIYNNFLREKLTPFISAYSHISWIGVYTTNRSVNVGGNYYYLESKVLASSWYKKVMATDDKVIVIASTDPDQVNPLHQVEHISIVRKMNEYTDLQNEVKLLKIDLAVSKIADIMEREQSYLNMALVDGQNRVIFSVDPSFSTPELDMFKPFNREAFADKAFFQEKKLGEAKYVQGWQLVGYTDAQKINQALKHSRGFVIILAVISTFVPTTLIYIIVRSFNYRIRKLSRHMEKVKNEKFDLINLQEGKDEIGGLIRSFNLMTAKIHSLIHDVYKLEIQKKDLELERIRAELNFLQSQLNPHFLFNTLNAVLVVCKKNKYGDVIGIIKDLSLLLRRLLSWRDDLIPLSAELNFTELYLNIEKFRFGDRFHHRFQVEPRAMDCPIPKMSIQPLVENACKHGLQTVKGIRMIEINAEISGPYLKISVIDNGKGIENELLAQILAGIDKEQPDKANIGIRNVFRRLRLYYGETVQYAIENAPGHGTTVWFKIPLAREPMSGNCSV